MDEENGWERSAAAWTVIMGETGDFTRQHVLDQPMLARVRAGGFAHALDVGCGEGRFCRLLQAEGIQVTGIDPTQPLIETAQARDPASRYVRACAESIPFGDETFDLVVSYLVLIDVDRLDEAIAEMVRVLRPGGSLLIANLSSFVTAGSWLQDDSAYALDNYLDERPGMLRWRGIAVRNWHRPFERYMRALLSAKLQLVHFEEPGAASGPQDDVEKHQRVPLFHVMEWRKPASR